MEKWTDWEGRSWPVVQSRRRLNFKYPAHAALRAHVFRRDNFSCRRCGAMAIDVPSDYDGRVALFTNTFVKYKKLRRCYPDVLIVDHVLTLAAGGRSHIDNLQSLCETCNKKKLPEDLAAARLAKQCGGLPT